MSCLRHTLTNVLAAGTLLIGVVAPSMLHAQPSNAVVGASILTESLPRGYFITAVMIEFEKQVDLRNASVPTAAVQVSGTRTSACAGVPSDAGARTIVSVYTNSAPRRSATAAKGNYLIIELDQNDANSRAFRGGCPLQLNYSASWGDLHNRFGRIEVAASAVSTTNQISPVVDDFIKGSVHVGHDDASVSAVSARTIPAIAVQPRPQVPVDAVPPWGR